MSYLANKKSYTIIVGVFILLIILGITFSKESEGENFVNQVNQKTVINQGVGGFNVFSMSLIDMSSKSPWLRGEKVWAVTVVGGGILGQSASVRVNPSDVDKSSKERPTSDFTIEIRNVEQRAEYNIIRSSNDPGVYDFDIRKWSHYAVIPTCEIKQAIEKTGSCSGVWLIRDKDGQPVGVRTKGTGIGWIDCATVCASNRAGIVGDIANPAIHSIIETGMYGGKDGQNYDGSIDTFNNVLARMGNEFNPMGAVAFQGGLVTGLPTINQNLYKAIFVSENVATPQWKVVDRSLYDTYNNKWDGIVGTCYCDSFPSICDSGCDRWDAVETRIVQVQQASDSVMRSNENFGTLQDKSSLNSGKIIVEVAGLLNSPVLTYFVKADWIGIYTPTPKAKIVQSSSSCFKSGDKNADILVRVKNVGDERGNFHVSATCPEPFDVGPGYTISLDSNQETEVHLTITGGGVDEKLQKQCTVKVSTHLEDITASVTACLDPDITCPANTKNCRDTQLWQCNQFGTAQKLLQDCAPLKCVADGLGARCEDPNVCNSNNICESNLGETKENCGDCSVCTSCTSWLVDRFKKPADRCTSKTVFEVKCDWYDVGCQTHNFIVPKWTQDQFCPAGISISLIIFVLIVIIIILILKKTGKIKSGTQNIQKVFSGWRSK